MTINILKLVTLNFVVLISMLLPQELTPENYNPHYSGAKKASVTVDDSNPYMSEVSAFAAAWQNRALEVLQKSKPVDTELLEQETDTFTFLFEGPTLDSDLTNFYAYFARNYPTAILPIEAQQDIAETNCKEKSPQACASLSHVVLYYGLLGRSFPDDFESKVLDVLRQRYGKTVIPGLLLRPYESPKKIWIGDGARVESTQKQQSVCRFYRLDGRLDCIRDQTSNFLYVRGQGLAITLQLPKSKRHLLDEFAKYIEPTEGFKSGYITFFEEKKLATHSAAYHSSASWPGNERPSSDGGIEISSYQGLCDPQVEGYPMFSDVSGLQSHAAQYRALVFPEGVHRRPSGNHFFSYPLIVFFDNFAGATSPRLSIEDPSLGHVDFMQALSADQLQQNASVCIDMEPLRVAGHGLFEIGLLAARQNGVGISGLLPDYDLDQIQGVHIETNTDLVQLLPVAESLALEGSGQTVLANLALSVEAKGNIEEQLSQIVQATAPTVLYIVAAGEPLTSATGEELHAKCKILPACLGNLPNVVTVAALDSVKAGSYPKIWPRSLRGRNGEKALK